MGEPLTPPKRPGVYVMAGVPGYVKIGRTSNIAWRMQNIQNGHPVPLRLVAVLSWDPEDEASFHKQWEPLRTIGEWFIETPELTAFLESRGPLPPEQVEADPIGPIPLAELDYERAADAFRVCKQDWGHIRRIPNAMDIQDLVLWKQKKANRRGLNRVTHGIVLAFGEDDSVMVTLGEHIAAAYARSMVRQAPSYAPYLPPVETRALGIESARSWLAARRERDLRGTYR